MISRNRGDTPPVIHARVYKVLQLARAEIWRSLNAYFSSKTKPRYGNRPNELFDRRRRNTGHFRSGLRSEVLNDDLLQMTIPIVRLPQRQ